MFWLSPEAFALYGTLVSFLAGHVNGKHAVVATALQFIANALKQPPAPPAPPKAM